MTRTHDPNELLPDLPVPVDDGACRHLPGMRMPVVSLRSSRGRSVDVGEVSPDHAAFFFYPWTGKPGVPPPKGRDEIPGARGCTPESCAFRDHHAEFVDRGVSVFGVSTQTPEDQLEFAIRNRIPYEILSDADRRLANALRLPTFDAEGIVLIKRLTLLVRGGVIERVFYPVFPPDRHAEGVLAVLEAERT